MVEVKIENVVASSLISREIDLERLSRLIPDSEYNPDEHQAMLIRLKEPRSAVFLLQNGKLVCTGMKSLEEAERVVKNVCSMLESSGIKTYKEPKIEILGIVASADLGREINLEELREEGVIYNPEEFPGLVYRIKEGVVMVFESGKLVGIGRKEEELKENVEKLVRNWGLENAENRS